MEKFSRQLSITILGSGTSAGVPMIGCHCGVCSSGDPRDHRSRPSIAVHYDGNGGGRNILIDTSPELRLQAVRNRLDRVDAVVYTHAHADHVFGLDDLRRYNTVMQAVMPIYAASDVLTDLCRVFPYAFEVGGSGPSTKDSLYRPELRPNPIDGPFDLFGERWVPIPLVHGHVTTLGFRVGNVAYCTDCNDILPASRELLRDLDVLIIDALRPRPHPTHMSFEQSLAMIASIRPRRAFFTHLSHDMLHADIEKSLPENIRVGYDGLKIETEFTL